MEFNNKIKIAINNNNKLIIIIYEFFHSKKMIKPKRNML